MRFEDPRIRGHLKEVLVASQEEANRDIQLCFELATEALKYAKKEKNSIGIAVSSIILAYAEGVRGNYDNGIRLALEVIEYSKRTREFRLLAMAYGQLAGCYHTQGDLDKAEQIYLTQIRLSEQYNIQDMLIRALGNLAPLYRYQGRLNEAINTAYRYKDLIESAGPTISERDLMFVRLRANDILAALYDDLGDTPSSLSYIEQSLQIALAYNWTNRISNGYNNLGEIYSKQGKYDEAIINFLKALEASSATKNPKLEIQRRLALCECYLKMGELVKAEAMVERAWVLCSGEDNGLAETLRFKGKIKFTRNDPESITLLLQALDIKHRLGTAYNTEDILNDICIYYKSTGDFEHALQYHEEYLNEVKKASDERQRTFAKVHSRHESERIEVEKKVLQLEIEKKQAELTLQTTQLVTQTELLAKFRDELREIVRHYPSTQPGMREVKEKLKELPCKQIDWEKFETEFAAVHPEFRRKLYERYPALTPMEVKMCSVLRLNLKSHEIARLFCLSERSVETHRFNIRRKLKLGREQSLSVFLNNL